MATFIERFEALEASATRAASALIEREPVHLIDAMHTETEKDALAIARHEVLAHVILNEKLKKMKAMEEELAQAKAAANNN